jgi:uncharacterized protein YciU (UPF0263 family)
MIPQAHLRFLRYDYLIEENPHISLTSYDETFSYGSLPTLLNRIRKFAQSPFFKHFTVRNADGHLENFDQFPKDALEEAIINAIMHRDYAVNTPIYCKLYRDAFVVENAGRILQPDRQMPENFTLETETLLPNARNRLLVEWTKLLTDEDGKPFVRGISEGTRKMKDLMQKMYFPYPKYKTNGKTAVTLQSVATPEEFEEQIRKHREHNTINMSIFYAESYETVLENLEKLIANKDNRIEKLQLSYNLALDKSPNFETAKVLYGKMKQQNIPLDEVSYNTLINKSQTFEQAERFFEEMKATNLKPNEISYSTLINKSETFEQAERFFKEMKAVNLKPNEISYNTLINKSETFEQAERFLKEMKVANLKPNEISYNTLINKSETFEQAESLFTEMENLIPLKKGNKESENSYTISYNTLINKSQTFEQAERFFKEMQNLIPLKKGNKENENSYTISYNTLINKSQTFEQAENFFKEMKTANLKLDEISYNTLINKSQTFEQAKSLFREMEKQIPLKKGNKESENSYTISYNTLINKSQTFEQQKPYYQEFLQKFPLQKGNEKSEKNYNYLFVALFKQIKTKQDFDFIKVEIYRLGLKLNDYTKSFYDNLEKKFN